MKFFIILISSIVVLITVATIMVGSKSFEGTVVEKPYETGLDWDKIQMRKSKLAWTVTINSETYRIGKNEVSISVRDSTGKPLPHAAVNVKLTRPSTNRFDKTFRTKPQQGGDFLATLDLPVYGNWDMVILVQNGSDESSFTQAIFAENR